MHFSTIVSAAAILVAGATPAVATFGNARCSLGSWYWADKGVCIKVGGPPSVPNPPSGNNCPNLWFWHGEKNCCAPRYIPPNNMPSCGNGWIWNPSSYSCKPPATPPPANNDCGPNKWWWKNRSCCLPHGNPSPPLPPRGNNCPPNWYWSGQQGCCVPNHPPQNPTPPSCPPNWEWSPLTQCCKPSTPTPPGPQPSKRATADNIKRNVAPQHKKKAAVKAQAAFCPTGLTACPIAGIFSSESECIDTLSELKSCGGCSSIGEGQDCSAIPNVGVYSCDSGSCKVLSCQDGYKVGENGDHCIPRGHEL